MFKGIVSPVKEAPDLVDPPISFDVLSGFVSHSNDVSITSFMDLSIHLSLVIVSLHLYPTHPLHRYLI